MSLVTNAINRIRAIQPSANLNETIDVLTLVTEEEVRAMEAQRNEMVRDRSRDTADTYYKVLGAGIAAVYRGNIVLRRQTWCMIKKFIDRMEEELGAVATQPNAPNHPCKFRIGIEILSVHLKINKQELYDSYGSTTSMTPDKLFDERLLCFLSNFASPASVIYSESSDGETTTARIKRFLSSGAVLKAAAKSIEKILGDTVDEGTIKNWIDAELSIYFTKSSLGYIRGATVRNGFVIVIPALDFQLADPRGFADMLSLAAQQFGHFVLRRHVFAQDLSTSSALARGGGKRVDSANKPGGIEDKLKLSGWEITKLLFDLIEPNWMFVIEPELGQSFVNQATTGQFRTLPIRRLGELPARKIPTILFSGSLRDGRAHIE